MMNAWISRGTGSDKMCHLPTTVGASYIHAPDRIYVLLILLLLDIRDK